MRKKREQKRPPPLNFQQPLSASPMGSISFAESITEAPYGSKQTCAGALIRSLFEPAKRLMRRSGPKRHLRSLSTSSADGEPSCEARHTEQVSPKVKLSNYRDPPAHHYDSIGRKALKLLFVLLAHLWSLACWIGMWVAAGYHRMSQKRPCKRVCSFEDGEMDLPPSRGGSATNESANQRRKRIAISVANSPGVDDDDGPAHSRVSSSYYYDVEEGEFQPSQRLLFKRTSSTADTSMSYSSSVVSLPSPMLSHAPNFQQQQQSPSPFDGSLQLKSEDGYFKGKYGDKIGGGAFHLIAWIGSGTYSSVWLALDVKGVTARLLPSMMHRMEDNAGYNSSANILSGTLQHAFVVLKVSRSTPAFVQACEEEFATNKMLLLELQRRGFSTDRFILYPSSFLQPTSSSSTLSPSKPSRPPSASEVHLVQVGEVCGPSLLHIVTDAPPQRSGGSLVDCRWRLNALRLIAKQVLEALHQLHQCHVVHSDIKPENILFAIPAVEFLEKMQSEERKGFLSSAHQARVRRNTLLAKYRLELLRHKSTFQQMLSRNKELHEGGMDEDDAIRSVCSVKVGDLGSSLRFKHASPKRNASDSSLAANTSSGGSSGTLASGSFSDGMSSGCPTPQARTVAVDRSTWQPHLVQTREYRAPEAIVQLQPSAMITPALDMWSYGCLIFELVTAHYLFHPRLFAVQQLQAAKGMAQSAQPTDDDVDRVHLKMIEELLCEAPPEEMLTEGYYSDKYFGDRRGSPPPPLSCKKALITSLLHHHLNISNDDDSVRGAACKRQWSEEIALLADFIGSTLEWLPDRRPSTSELLQHQWLQLH